MEDDPTYEIEITSVDGQATVNEESLRESIAAALGRHGVRVALISVALVDDDRMTELNTKYLAKDRSTDVLAFDLGDGIKEHADGAVGGPATIEGEIVISVDTAAREASVRGHDVDAELALYAVHGTLHLLGYDDGNEDDADRMHRVEDEILSSVGMGAVYRAGSE